LVKTDGQNKLLDGSEFKIYNAETDGAEVTVVRMLDAEGNQITTDDGYNMYRKARVDEPGNTVIVVNGKVRIVGLDNGVYWLEETKAPDGYNAITSRQKFTISDNNLDAIITGGIVSTNSGVQVVNHTGTMLPDTGGMGTALFITIGSILVLGAGVVLVTKKRMANIAE
ncbi:MAG: LPXTG cell wall anchor domain-containing protein, partial [Oscillospiraceae bacterium]|nr:LPXTG cell wall anchor domain-containing protein [Oscillospiraceae bacterium]